MPSPSYISSLVHQHVTETLSRLKKSDGKSAAGSLREAERLSLAFHERRAEIQADSRLTIEGRFDAVRVAAKETLAALEKWHRPLRDGLSAHEHQLRTKLREAVVERPPSDVAERVERVMLHAEIRREASSMTAQQLEVLYRNGTAEVRRALESLPRIQVKAGGTVTVERFVSDALIAEVLGDGGREKLPETADELDDLHQVRDVFQVVAASVEAEIRRAAPDAFEPVEPRVA